MRLTRQTTVSAAHRDTVSGGSARVRVLLAFVLFWVVSTALLLVAGRDSWWRYIALEQSPMTWLQSVVLVLTAAASLQVAVLVRRLQLPIGASWALLSFGFAALAFDERFAIHERVRDRILAPSGVRIPFLPWVGPGDFLMILLAVAGLAVLPLLWRGYRGDAWARTALLVGIGLALVAVAMDSIDPESMALTLERVEQTAEEVVEFGSALAFLASVVFRQISLIVSLTAPPTAVEPPLDVVTERTTNDQHAAVPAR
ncbi:hypothetical protein [Piscicoccus intestinalis]|uniref:hypothetical protein n=1 Tax=Piscicoccus intestinalis TaxID=746033 RepID=UPI0012EED527|nr:hypothetical protein [Piscicoccus intestinalis]